jgi:hypothetical protein
VSLAALMKSAPRDVVAVGSGRKRAAPRDSRDSGEAEGRECDPGYPALDLREKHGRPVLEIAAGANTLSVPAA